MNGIALQNVVVALPGSFRLGPLDLEVGSQEYVAVLGASGSGKTTLLRAVAGLVPLAGGSIRLGGERVDGDGLRVLPERRRLGMVFQSLALWPHLTARRHVELVLRARGAPAARARDEAQALLSRVRLERLAERKPHQLSGGEAQRLALARALAGAPRALLLDEPFAHLDLHLRRELALLLAGLRRADPLPVLHVTHDPTEVLTLAARFVVIEAGRVDCAGSFAALAANPTPLFRERFLGPLEAAASQLSQAVEGPA